MALQMKDNILITEPDDGGFVWENKLQFLFVSAEAELANLVCK